MRASYDLLYTLFEQHLFSALIEEESSDEFLDRVVREYMRLLSARGAIPHEFSKTVESDLKEEVLEMLRKKTYGHYSLSAFRKAVGPSVSAQATKKSRRGGQAS